MIRVMGKVQGVAFRYYTKLNADRLGVLGTTENIADGSVRIYAFGEEEVMDEFIRWCREGSPASSVEEVRVTELSVELGEQYEEFIILR